MITPPAQDPSTVTVVRGPNIKPLPTRGALESDLQGEVLIKVGDNISTDTILPAGAEVLPLRSNIPAISRYVFRYLDPEFVPRAQKSGGGFIIAGSNYGQGSSREHAVLAPMYLGVKAVIAKSYARIHRSNLVNFGIAPLTFKDPSDYETIRLGNLIRITNVKVGLEKNGLAAEVMEGSSSMPENLRDSCEDPMGRLLVPLKHDLTNRETAILFAGGLLNYTKMTRICG
jgi:aconitate hydratase